LAGSTLLADLLREAWGAITARRMRSIMTAAGIAVGLLTLTATVALTSTLAAQVSGRFDALLATTVTINGYHPAGDPADPYGGAAALDRVRSLHGVEQVGLLTAASGDAPQVRINPYESGPAHTAGVVAMDPAALAASQVDAVRGRLFDDGAEQRHDSVVLVGDLIARTLGLSEFTEPVLIHVAQTDLLVIGIAHSQQSGSPVGLSLIVPNWMTTDPAALGVHFDTASVLIHTARGAATQVGQEAPIALSPSHPQELTAVVPPDPKTLLRQVQSDTATIVLVLGAVSLIVGALGVSNTMLVSVMERRHEIGVRRALGATTPTILTQILGEGILLGFAGGAAGGLLGINITALVALLQGWTLVAPYWLLAASPTLGATVGLLAGLYPARRAATIQPVAALAG
jgi:putative ABC transport system permease protein